MVSFSKRTVTWGLQKGVFLLKFFKTVIFTFSWALHTKLKHSMTVSFLSNMLEKRWIANILSSLNHYMINLVGILSIIFTTIGLYHYVKCPNVEFFLVRIFPHSDWIRTRKNSAFGHFSRIVCYIFKGIASKILTARFTKIYFCLFNMYISASHFQGYCTTTP